MIDVKMVAQYEDGRVPKPYSQFMKRVEGWMEDGAVVSLSFRAPLDEKEKFYFQSRKRYHGRWAKPSLIVEGRIIFPDERQYDAA